MRQPERGGYYTVGAGAPGMTRAPAAGAGSQPAPRGEGVTVGALCSGGGCDGVLHRVDGCHVHGWQVAVRYAAS